MGFSYRWTDRLADICECRVAFVTENLLAQQFECIKSFNCPLKNILAQQFVCAKSSLWPLLKFLTRPSVLCSWFLGWKVVDKVEK